MKKAQMVLLKLVFLLLILVSGHYFYQSFQMNQIRSNLLNSGIAVDLKNKLSLLSSTYEVPTPKLEFRLNHSSEGYYNHPDDQITILVKIEDLEDTKFLEAILAHEFAHHYMTYKMPDIKNEEVEITADFIARDLVGSVEYLKALTKGVDRPVDEYNVSIEMRIKTLNQYPDHRVLNTD